MYGYPGSRFGEPVFAADPLPMVANRSLGVGSRPLWLFTVSGALGTLQGACRKCPKPSDAALTAENSLSRTLKFVSDSG
jgi:hypothetical protein